MDAESIDKAVLSISHGVALLLLCREFIGRNASL